MPPAISTSSETYPIPEISGSSHSSKNTLGRFGNRSAPLGLRPNAFRAFLRAAEPVRSHRPSRPPSNHIEDPGDASLIEGMDIEPTADEIRGNAGLEIGERQDKIRAQGEDLVDVRRREGAHAQFLTASLWWPHNIAGDADDAVLLTQQIQRLDVSSVRQTIRFGGNIKPSPTPSARRQRTNF